HSRPPCTCVHARAVRPAGDALATPSGSASIRAHTHAHTHTHAHAHAHAHEECAKTDVIAPHILSFCIFFAQHGAPWPCIHSGRSAQTCESKGCPGAHM